MDSDRMGAMLETDFRTVLKETGKASLSFPLASGTLTVDAFARYSGDGKRVPPQNYSVSGFNSERGSFAEALVRHGGRASPRRDAVPASTGGQG